ncbi:MAG: epoxyqueuosine reductase QueH [Treponema sp.]|jgi:predicted adenine nucleotide alpha hydrolase (AANH) superfamily ATPase|nr:epoxyqueuosine reductase QueH [Treponema sp.]
MKLLLHCCCAPCTVECAGVFLDEGRRPALFWYNPNIHPFTEYRSRRDALAGYAQAVDLPLEMIDEYGLRPFLAAVREESGDTPQAAQKAVPDRDGGPENAAEAGPPGRCARCYRMRLEKTAVRAAEGGYDAFSTTLLISPYQRHELVAETAEEEAKKHGVPFLYRDFRSRFRKGQARARELGLYMQKYCGCIFSEEERYLPRTPPGAKK